MDELLSVTCGDLHMKSRAAWLARRLNGWFLYQNQRPQTLKRTAQANLQADHADASVAGHLTPVAPFEVHLNKEPSVRLGQLHYLMPH